MVAFYCSNLLSHKVVVISNCWEIIFVVCLICPSLILFSLFTFSFFDNIELHNTDAYSLMWFIWLDLSLLLNVPHKNGL